MQKTPDAQEEVESPAVAASSGNQSTPTWYFKRVIPVREYHVKVVCMYGGLKSTLYLCNRGSREIKSIAPLLRVLLRSCPVAQLVVPHAAQQRMFLPPSLSVQPTSRTRRSKRYASYNYCDRAYDSYSFS